MDMVTRFRFNLEEAYDELWDTGMDEDPRRTGHINIELEARDGQAGTILEDRGENGLCVQWDDGTQMGIPSWAGIIQQ